MRTFFNFFGLIVTCVGGGIFGAYAALEGTVGLIVGAILFVVGLAIIIVVSCVSSKHVKKNRTSFKIDFTCDKAAAEEKIQNFLNANGFKQRQYLDETVYQKGNGFWTGRHFIKYSLEESHVLVEGWISSGFGKAVTTEQPLDSGFYGAFPKQNLRSLINELGAQLSE